MKRSFDNPIKLTPIYIDIYTPDHLEKYLQQRQLEIRSIPLTNGSVKKEPIVSTDKIDLPQKSVPSTGRILNDFLADKIYLNYFGHRNSS